MNEAQIFKINEARALSETLEGETIIINLETGSYYSMNESGTVVWDAFKNALRVRDVVDVCLSHYNVTRELIVEPLDAFLVSLEKEGLIIPSESATSSVQFFQGEKKDFVAPHLEVYKDLQQMLLADPIHDVGAEGWPVLKT